MKGISLSGKAALSFFLISLMSISCSAPREAEEAEDETVGTEEDSATKRGESNALEEYISEPKSRARDAKAKVERAQGAAKQQMYDE